jgi:hypothetical protein
VPKSPPLDEAGLAVLMDPARNAEGVFREETFKFLRRYLPKAVDEYDYQAVQAVAEEYLCTKEITPRLGIYVRSFAWPPILALAHVVLYRLRWKADPAPRPGMTPLERVRHTLLTCEGPDRDVYILAHARELDEHGPCLPELLSAHLELGAARFEPRETFTRLRDSLCLRGVTFLWDEALLFPTIPALYDPFHGLELVARYTDGLEIRLAWGRKRPRTPPLAARPRRPRGGGAKRG